MASVYIHILMRCFCTGRLMNIGVAVGAPQGLVVPVIRDVDKMNFATVETTMSVRAGGGNGEERRVGPARAGLGAS